MKLLRKKFFLLSAALILSLLSFLSCVKETYDMDTLSDEIYWAPSITGPMVQVNLSLADMVEKYDTNGYISEDENSLLHFIYSDTLYSHIAQDLINIRQQNFLQIYIDSEIGTPEFLSSPIGDTTNFHKDKNYDFLLENEAILDSMYLKTGDLNLSVTSSFRHIGILTITSGYIVKNGQDFRKVIQISAADGSFSWNELMDVSGYTLLFDNSNPDTTFLPVSFDLQLINSGAGINPGEKCEITMNFSNLDFYALFGYIGDYELLVDSSQFNLDFFEEFPDGEIKFEDPRLTIGVSNSFGIPVRGELKNFSAHSSETGQTVDITFDPGINPFSIVAPTLSEMGETKETVITVSYGNSNISDAIDIKPDLFNYGIDIATIPAGASERNYFVLDTSRINAEYEIDIPVWLTASGLVLEKDSLDFDFEKDFGDISDRIRTFTLMLDVDNWLPFDIELQVYFKDGGYQVVDSMFGQPEPILASDPSSLDANGRIATPTRKVTEISYTRERLDKMEPVKYMMVKAILSTTSQGQVPVKVYSFYTIDVRLGVKVDFAFNSRD